MLQLRFLQGKARWTQETQASQNCLLPEFDSRVEALCREKGYVCVVVSPVLAPFPLAFPSPFGPSRRSLRSLSCRTKWKRQTAVGLELLAEAGNYSALQRMFPSPYFYHPSLLGSMDSTTAAAAAAAMYSSMYRTPPAPHPQLQRPLVPRVLIHGLGPGGQPALNPLSNPLPGTPHPR